MLEFNLDLAVRLVARLIAVYRTFGSSSFTVAPDSFAEWGNLLTETVRSAQAGHVSWDAVYDVLGCGYIGSVNSSAKVMKGEKVGFDTYVIYLEAGDVSGVQVCPKLSDGCGGKNGGCLVGSGRMIMSAARRARLLRTWAWRHAPAAFDAIVRREIMLAKARAERAGRGFAVRLNGTSDLLHKNIVTSEMGVDRYEYTKVFKYLERDCGTHWTFSVAEDNWDLAREAYRLGFNLAIPVLDAEHALGFSGTYSQDEHDVRLLDREENPGRQIGILTVKRVGKAAMAHGIETGFFMSPERFADFHAFLTA